jgi:hypothetical protein
MVSLVLAPPTPATIGVALRPSSSSVFLMKRMSVVRSSGLYRCSVLILLLKMISRITKCTASPNDPEQTGTMAIVNPLVHKFSMKESTYALGCQISINVSHLSHDLA